MPPTSNHSNSNPDFGRFKHLNFQSDDQTSNDNKIVVIKIGSSSITRSDGKVCLSTLSKLVEFIYELKQKGYDVVLVSSGAVSMGMGALNFTQRPTDVVVKQALASVGQSKLMGLYDSLFGMFGLTTAQILLTRDNISSDFHYLNATNTLMQLLSHDYNVIPIVNENDTVSTNELRLGDNDQLSAYVASMINASHLFLLTDVDSLYTANPKTDPTATPIHFVDNMNAILKQYSNIDETSMQSNKFGTGGMHTKILAAKVATSCGVLCSIVSSDRFCDVLTILNKDYSVGTTFNCHTQGLLSGRNKFIFIGMVPSGSIYIKTTALTHHSETGVIANGFDIHPADILYCDGIFEENTCVNIIAANENFISTQFPSAHSPNNQMSNSPSKSSLESPVGNEDDIIGVVLGRGLVNFSSTDIKKVRGLVDCQQCALILGLKSSDTVNVIDAENCAVKL